VVLINEKLQIKITEMDIDRWRPIGPDNIKISIYIFSENKENYEFLSYIWPKSISGDFWNLIKENLYDMPWGLSYKASYIWLDNENIKIDFFKDKKMICNVTIRFIVFAKMIISFFDDLIKLLDERSICNGYSDYKKDNNRKLTLKYRSNIIMNVEKWKKNQKNNEKKAR
jgi:hypothetical protein